MKDFLKNNLLFVLIFAMFIVLIGIIFYFNSCNKPQDDTAFKLQLKSSIDSINKAYSLQIQALIMQNKIDSVENAFEFRNIYTLLDEITLSKTSINKRIKTVLSRPRSELDSFVKYQIP